jgi:L-cysteine S-thiosulfotransferase
MKFHLPTVACSLVLISAWAAWAQTPPVLTPAQQAGKAVVLDRKLGNCVACHTMPVSDVPSTVGPALMNMKQYFPDRQRLVAILENEQTINPQTVMPLFGKNLILDHQQIEDVVDYLYSF